ncbi:MAG: TetR/AcrR family transcriptional regulator [Oscillospiraceae bacterium]
MNNVQFGGDFVANIKNMKQHILENAREIAIDKGVSNINMRDIAKASGVAIGTIYNYYPTKGDLIADIVAMFWQDAFANININLLHTMDFEANLEYIYFELLQFLNSFKSDWLSQLAMLSKDEKNVGRAKEKAYLAQVYNIVLLSLNKNKAASLNYSDAEREKLASLIFEIMLMMLREGEQDFSLFKKVLNKILSE